MLFWLLVWLREISIIFKILEFEKVKTKVITVTIERDDGNLGITLRGGFHQNSNLSRPVIITYVKPDGPAARCSTFYIITLKIF